MTELPGWVSDPILQPTWDRVRRRFEAGALRPVGRVEVVTDSRELRHAVGDLLGRTLTRDRIRIDLADLDQRLRERSGHGGLAAVLTALDGRSPVDRPGLRAARAEARQRPLNLARDLLDTPWVAEWIDGLTRSGRLAGRDDADLLILQATSVLAEVTAGPEGDETAGKAAVVARSRVELAAQVLGDAHALDRDRPLHQMVVRGLAAAAGEPAPQRTADAARLWRKFGLEPDLLSGTVLVLRIGGAGAGPVAERLAVASRAGDPVHLTERDVRRVDLQVDRPVLVCENPRVVEALAESDLDGWAAVCTSGEPTLLVRSVLTELATIGAQVFCHGDFDWPGVGILNRTLALTMGDAVKMSADDYLEAVRADGPPLLGHPADAMWDSDLAPAMRLNGRAVHEESVLAGLFEGLAGHRASWL